MVTSKKEIESKVEEEAKKAASGQLGFFFDQTR